MKLALAAVLLCAPAFATNIPRPEIAAAAPRGWMQFVEGPFSYFLPREAPGFRLRWEHGYYLDPCETGERVRIHGRLAEITRGPREGGGYRVKACFYAPTRGAKRLTVWADAESAEAADDAMTALRTIRFSERPAAPR